MDEFDDLGSYNGDTCHDMWVDSDYKANTGEPSSPYGNTDSEDYDDSF